MVWLRIQAHLAGKQNQPFFLLLLNKEVPHFREGTSAKEGTKKSHNTKRLQAKGMYGQQWDPQHEIHITQLNFSSY